MLTILKKEGFVMNKRYALLFFLLTIIASSIFITSGLFVDEINVPKFYISTILTLVLCISILLFKGRNELFEVLKDTLFFKGLYLIGVAQGLFGMLQIFKLFPSLNPDFPVTGSFDNPAGFSATISLLYPFGLLWFLKEKSKLARIIILTSLLSLFLIVIFSGSRTGILSLITSSIVFAFCYNSNKLKHFTKQGKLKLSIFFLALFLVLYVAKRESANGRLLIWIVSSEMIKDKPFLGHGSDSFKALYMQYQARYFKKHPNSRFQHLAGNVQNPFNFFIKVAVQYGCIGLLLFLVLFSTVVYRITKYEDPLWKGLLLSCLAAIFVQLLFSYPLRYIVTWNILAIICLIGLKVHGIKLYKIKALYPVITLSIICVGLLIQISRSLYYEILWKQASISAYKENYTEALPLYGYLYHTSFKSNPYFLYNFGAELHMSGRYDQSQEVLLECQKVLNDYDLQMLFGVNYERLGKNKEAIRSYKKASYMIPNRFFPLYQIFEVHNANSNHKLGTAYAKYIVNKEEKVPSTTVYNIKKRCREYLMENSENGQF